MKKIVALIFTIALFVSCDDDKKEAIKVDFITKESADECDGVTCPLIDVSYPQLTTTLFPVATLNKHIEQAVVAIIESSPQEEVKGMTVDEALANFKKEFKQLQKDFPESKSDFEAKVQGEVTYETPTLVSISLNSFMYKGGAHGYTATKYINLDGKTGALLTTEDLFTDVAAFKKAAEKAFRAHEKIADDTLLKDAGYWFENDVFQLPENIGFSENEISLFYNPYEITPYAEGPVEVTIPLAQVQKYLAFIPAS